MNIESIVDIFLIGIKKFILSGHRNQWIQNKYGKIYVRKSFRNINGRATTTFDIASVEINEKYRRMGICSSLILAIHETHKLEATFVESVSNNHLHSWLMKNKWECKPQFIAADDIQISDFWLKK